MSVNCSDVSGRSDFQSFFSIPRPGICLADWKPKRILWGALKPAGWDVGLRGTCGSR